MVEHAARGLGRPRRRIAPVLAFACVAVATWSCAAHRLAPSAVRPDVRSVVVVGRARFTVITPDCIRMEYAPDGRFVDAPSLLAALRPGPPPARVTRLHPSVTLRARHFELTFHDDGRPFHEGNLEARLRIGDVETVWRPGMIAREPLGGATAPPLLARDGWCVLDDSRTPLLVDGRPVPRSDSGAIDWYFIGFGSDYPAALRALAAIGGPPPLPPRAAFGVWTSVAGDVSPADIQWTVEQFDGVAYPLDVVAAGGGSTATDQTDPLQIPELIRWLRDRSLGIVPRWSPWDLDGATTTARVRLPPPVPAEALGWVLDASTSGSAPLALPAAEATTWAVQALDQWAAARGRRLLTVAPRTGLWDFHRPACAVLGQDASSATLGQLAAELARAGTAGTAFGIPRPTGFASGQDAESDLRWTQLAAVSPVMWLPWVRQADPAQPPWGLESWLAQAIGSPLRLRAMLVPYLYSMAWRAHRDAVPLIRPLYWHHPDAPEAYDNPQAFYVGDHFVCAPITTPGIGPGRLAWQRVWLPPGVWHHFFTGERFEGGRTILAAADATEMPLFVQAGYPIPLAPLRARPGAMPLDALVVRVFPSAGAGDDPRESLLYEDDGTSRDYVEGHFALTPLRFERSQERMTLTLGPTRGTFRGQRDRRAWTVELGAVSPPHGVWVNGQAAAYEYDEPHRAIRIMIASRPIRQALTVTVEAVGAAPYALAEAAFARRLEALAPGRTFTSVDEWSADDERAGLLEGLLALLGVGVVENETTGAPPSVLRRVVRAGLDEWLSGADVEVRYALETDPAQPARVFSAGHLAPGETVGDVAAPPPLPDAGAHPVRLWRELVIRSGETVLRSRRLLREQPAVHPSGGPEVGG